MKIVIFGASGKVGRRITQEALDRGHSVKAVVRDPVRFELEHERLQTAKGNVLDPSCVAASAAGCDTVISAVGPTHGSSSQVVVDAARTLIAGLPEAGVRRLVVVGGAGSLWVAPGSKLMDSPDFPEAWKGVAIAHGEALEIYRKSDLDWTCISPAALLEPGKRTGVYRIGGDQLLTDARGESRISIEDYAVALLDEVEHPAHIQKRFTVAY